MEKRPTVHFSNRLEELACHLGNQLFTEGADPFAEKVVILPSHSLKLYLTSFFASHPKWSICIGITFKTLLNGALHFFSEEELQKFPSPLALSFILEQEIDKIAQEEIDGFPELKEFMDPPTEKKRIWLSEQLSRLFSEYGTFEAKALDKWKEGKGWKQTLWSRVFKRFKCLSEELTKKEIGAKEVHLFGFSHIPSHFYQFFCHLGMHIYFVSPSTYFWEDLCSDQERIFLEKKMEGKKVCLQVREQMTFFLKESHPLLANWGKVGRSLLRKVGDTESYLEEEYIDPLTSELSVLTYLQSGLFQLEEEKKEISLKDTSILCLSATSKLREVESLYETLQELMVLDEEIEPKDILVLGPDLESYFPYIQMVFGSQQSRIGYSVHGLSLALSEEGSQALMFFFTLAESRFDRDLVLKFFSFPSVMKKFGWKEEDIKLFKQWFEMAHVLWGFNPEHKKLCLEKVWPQDAFAGTLAEEGTWEEGISRLIKGLAMDLDSLSLDEEQIPSSWPLPQVSWTESELLGEFIAVLYSLQEDLKSIYEGKRQTIDEWSSLVQKWISFYFEKSHATDALSQDLESLKQELEENVSIPFSFTSFKKAIEAHFHRKKESFQSSHLNTVKFLSMELGGSYPSKVICAIGCDEGSFPRTPPPSCLDISGSAKEVPSITDQDRYLFLEMILNARKAFVCSYQRMSWKDQKEQGPSLLIQDLINDLDKNYFFSNSTLKPSQVLTRNHPEMNFDQSYFQKEGFTSYSLISFLSAQSYYLEKKKKLPAFFCFQGNPDIFSSKVIEIKKLQEFAKDPSRLYFKEKLGIFFDFALPKEEEFFLSAITRSQMKKEAFQKGLKTSVARAKAKGELPLGDVGELAVRDLEEDLEELQKHLKDFQVNLSDLFSIEFSEDAKILEKKEGKIILPPLVIEIAPQEEVSLVGNLDLVSPQGFLWLGRASKPQRVELFPSLLILSCLSKSLGVEPKALLLKTGKAVSLKLEDPFEQLKLYLKLYIRSMQEFCPIRPEWSLDFLEKSPDEIEKKRLSSSSFKGFIDPYEEWILKRDALPSTEEVYAKWKSDWERVFSPLLSAAVE
jgi:exodeoxyribonuclease V gamma subunit